MIRIKPGSFRATVFTSLYQRSSSVTLCWSYSHSNAGPRIIRRTGVRIIKIQALSKTMSYLQNWEDHILKIQVLWKKLYKTRKYHRTRDWVMGSCRMKWFRQITLLKRLRSMNRQVTQESMEITRRAQASTSQMSINSNQVGTTRSRVKVIRATRRESA